MKRKIDILSLIIIAGLLGTLGCSTLHKSDSARLQGTWKGQEVGNGSRGQCALVISGQNLEFRGADAREWYKGTFALKEDSQLRQLVGTIADCPVPRYVGKTVYAIYRLEGNTLTLTGNEPGVPEVPTSFDAPAARQFVLKKE